MELKLFWVRLTRWEFWPFHLVYLPVYFYWLCLSLRARSFFFFSASNPSIETGGMLGESKYDILKKIPSAFVPKTVFVPEGTAFSTVIEKMEQAGLSFPLIAKPDIGQRGIKVEKIAFEKELGEYLRSAKFDILLQEFVDYPLEAGVFYFRHPDWEQGIVSSVVIKEFLKVTGDGKSTISELMQRYPRASFQYNRLLLKYPSLMKYVLPEKQEYLLEPIGNHSRGTTFLNGNHIIDEKLTQVFDRISKSIEGFYFGRFDLKCASLSDLKEGKNIRILELNGAGSEPAHIYHPGSSLWKAYKDLFYHWTQLFEISRKNNNLGVPYMSAGEVWRKYKWLKAYNKKLT